MIEYLIIPAFIVFISALVYGSLDVLKIGAAKK
jgi:hypothetical protein